VGHTHNELGGSHLGLVNALQGGAVPRVDLENAPVLFNGIHSAISGGMVRSCHDLSEGGLAVSAAEMAFAGGLGLSLDLTELSRVSDGLEDPVLLFSESSTRFLVEVTPDREEAFRQALEGQPVIALGTVQADDQLRISGSDGHVLIDSRLADLKQAWQSPLDWD
jgi:phosphoribosylformylglycinamidine synthase